MLPAEIIDFIFSFLQRDRAVLKSCSAAHPILSHLAERHLFSHIIVYLYRGATEPDGFLVNQLARSLSEKPHLANHIRSITIDAHAPFLLLEDPELSTLLPLMKHSEEVKLRNVQWLVLSANFRSSLLDFLRTSHMKSLSLQGVFEFPSAVLDDLKNIKNLTIDFSICSFSHSAALPVPTSLESLSLVRVSLDPYTTWADPRLNNLTSLHVKLVPFPDLSPILNVCSESLTTLTLEIGNSFQSACGFCSSTVSPLGGFLFDLSSLVSLDLITIHAKVCSQTKPVTIYDSSLFAISQLVASAGPSLKRAVLNLDCTVGVALELRDAMEWGPLVQLCGSRANPRVELCICAASYVPISFVEVVDSLVGNDDLSRLVELGSLVIKPLSIS